jgi:hypothetical protein
VKAADVAIVDAFGGALSVFTREYIEVLRRVERKHCKVYGGYFLCRLLQNARYCPTSTQLIC